MKMHKVNATPRKVRNRALAAMLDRVKVFVRVLMSDISPQNAGLPFVKNNSRIQDAFSAS
jgi:hypothetical protein